MSGFKRLKHKRINNLGKYGKKGCVGKNASHWINGRKIVDGYMYIYHPFHPFATKQGYVLEHRLIMEKHLKRYLTKNEVVHHGNEIKLDNRFVNLSLQNNQSEHNCQHIKIRNKRGRFMKGVMPV